MNKLDLIKAVAEKTNTSLAESTKVINAFLEVVQDTLANEEDVILTGFGTFKVSSRAERKSRNPQTGEEIIVPATKVPTFKAGKQLKDSVK